MSLFFAVFTTIFMAIDWYICLHGANLFQWVLTGIVTFFAFLAWSVVLFVKE